MNRNLIILLGPPAVGKMTIGQELSRLINYQLFHNHLIIEALLPIFAFESVAFKKLCAEFRTKIFQEIIKDAQFTGLIFTYVCNYKSDASLSNLLSWISLFKQANFGIYIVELTASLAKRLERNKSANRIIHKASKRDLIKSTSILLENEQEWSMQAPENVFEQFNYLRINNENIKPEVVARVIVDSFRLK